MKKASVIILFVISVIIITICSDTSPLYHFRPSPDPSIFFMCGRALGENLVPYVDFADTKGILLILIYYIATLIDNTSFLGVYIIQCFGLFFTLYFSQKTASLYLSSGGSFLASLALSIFLFDYFPYMRGGGVEEIQWPFMSALVYFLCKRFESTDSKYAKLLYSWIGIFLGVSFLIKYSVTIPLGALGVILLIIEYKKSGIKAAISFSLRTILSALITAIPFLIYLYLIGGMKGFMQEYVLAAFRYSIGENREWYVHLVRPIPARCLSDFLMWIAIIWGIKTYGIKSFYSNKGLMSIIILYCLFKGEMLSMYNYYYNSILSPLMISCCIFFVSKLEQRVSLDNNKNLLFISSSIILVLFIGSLWNIFGALSKGNFIWTESKGYYHNIQEALSTHKDKKILYMDWLDRGFGIPLNWAPCARYWFLQNYPASEMITEQFEYIKQQKPDIIHVPHGKYDALMQSNGYNLLHREKKSHFYIKNPNERQ